MQRSLRFFGHPAFPLAVVSILGCADDRRQPNGIQPCVGVAAQTAQGGNDSGGGASSQGGSAARGGSSNRGGDSGSNSGSSSGGNGGSSMGADGGGGTMGSCDLPWSEPPDTSECDLDSLTPGDTTLSGVINEDLTLAANHTYELDGEARISAGRTLTIEPCVKILGQNPESILAILPGARIEAAGLENSPIVFTSSKPKGQRAPGDWGGLMLLGNARDNLAMGSEQPLCEGLADAIAYGSSTDDNNDESSGTLAYVRVEYVGRVVSAANESNGITLCGVGSGTTMHHVMVSNSIDDCFEWFGGTVSADHLVALNCDDDMFDTDRGYSGTVQYVFGRHFETSPEDDNSNGFEMDNNANNPTLTPRTSTHWSNVTLCGGEGTIQSLPRMGMMLRRGLSGSITNTIVRGFDVGFSLRDLPTTEVELTHLAIFGNQVLYDPSTVAQGGLDWLEGQEDNVTITPEGLCDCRADPPNPFPIEAISGGPTDAFPDDSADFKGAFREATVESNWMRGAWVDWSDN